MKNQKTEHYKQMIRQLTLENKELKAKLQTYDENRLSKLVEETAKLKENYKALMKEAVTYRNEYETLVKKQRQMLNRFQKEQNKG